MGAGRTSTMTGTAFLAMAILLASSAGTRGQEYAQTPSLHVRGPLPSCYNELGLPQRCIPEFENAAYGVLMEANNTCGDNGDIRYCIQTAASTRKSCDTCVPGQFQSYFLTDLHHGQENQTWWQSETMNEGIQYPNQVDLTLHLGKAFDITYVRIVFYSPRPESFAIYKRTRQDSNWEPYQYYSASCRETYELPDFPSADRGAETRALCTSEYSDISPLRGGNVAFSTLEGRPSAYSFDMSTELQEWVTATDIKITLDRLNTFGDEVFGDQQVLQSYWYAIADVAVGARCKCNGHASKCDVDRGHNGERLRICRCEHNTAGPDCNKCMDYYNDAPWGRATQQNVHECKACNCNGYSKKCYFDQELWERTGHGGHCIECMENRDGPNCERCKQNYHQRGDNVCVACNCNPTGSRSLQCNSEGKCQCKPGVTGDKCDRCASNFYEFSNSGCKPCGCSEAGSFRNLPRCDSYTGICQCKENVEGKRCRECKPGFFNLDLENEYGCTPCFCYGHSAECQSAPGYSKVTLESNFARNSEKWVAQDDQHRSFGLQYIPLQQSIAVSSPSSEQIFFISSDQFLGDQRASYNHDLKFTLKINEDTAYPSSSDIILEGAGTYVSAPIFSQENPMPSREAKDYSFRLNEHPDYGWSPKLSARAFMSILSNLTSIRIRGTYSIQGHGTLDNVRLETAHRGAAGHPATWVEMCNCPVGYVGQFCESCAPGYRHNPANGGPFKPCIPCDCNGHADICDSETGRCICKHSTSGDNCELCARGFYGNALLGTSQDCTQCPCPNNGACIQMADSTIVCTECPTGYAGIKCDLCSDGYYGDPTGIFGPVQICKPCDCNLNVDMNAVGNCNRTTGECLKCIYNTAGNHCDQCLPGYYGDALAPTKGDCQQCECNPVGTLENESGTPICDPLNGQCACRPHVQGRNCDKCEDGFFNIIQEDGCQSCNCDPEGSFNSTCNTITGQCYCKAGITGLQCNMCKSYHYGFSGTGCQECMCDQIGSKDLQCHPQGQCPCYDNVEGRRCDRCKENKYDRQRGCIDCPPCYNLVQDAVNVHRTKLRNLQQMLSDIEKKPTVIPDSDFDNQLQTVKTQIEKLAKKAEQNAGASDGGKSLSQRLDEMTERLVLIKGMLDNIDTVIESANKFSEDGNTNITAAKDIIEASRKELENAVEYFNTDGKAALAKAQNRSDQFGQQSTQMSIIARDSRLITEQLEKDAKIIRDIAESAFTRSSEAYKLAKDGLGQQSNISNELRLLAGEINLAENKLNNVQDLTTQSLARSSTVYERALDGLSEVDRTIIPKIDTAVIKNQAEDTSSTAKEIQGKIDKLMSENKESLEQLSEQIKKSKELLEEGSKQEGVIQDMLTVLDQYHDMAEKAVKQGKTTLADATNIANTLKQFHEQVQSSKDEADKALLQTPAIEDLITRAENLTFSIEGDLTIAGNNAKAARNIAQDAHHKYAKQASQDASEIRQKSAETKLQAGTLRDEANQLSGRVGETERKIKELEERADEDSQLTGHAKMKVGQAKTDANEAQKLVKKAIDDINTITEELTNVPTLDDMALDTLERHLKDAELELKRADLSSKIKLLQDTRSAHQRWLKKLETDAKLLENEVENVKNINDVLPDNQCFKRLKLEP